MWYSIVVHTHWSRSQSMVVKVRDVNGVRDVPLIPWPIKITLNSDQIQLAIIRTHPHTITEPPQMEWFPGCCWRHLVIPSVICRRKRLSIDQWIFLPNAIFHLWRTWHHAKRAAVCAGEQGNCINVSISTKVRTHLSRDQTPTKPVNRLVAGRGWWRES